MTSLVPRPGRYPFHARNVSISLPTVADGVGYAPETIADPDVANALGKASGNWLQYADVTCLKIDDIFDPNLPSLVRGESLTYPTSSGLANLVPASTAAFVGGGCRVDFDETVMSIFGYNPATFQPNMRTWFYGKPAAGPGEYPSIRAEIVALATPSSPLAGEAVLGGVDTDATDVVSNLSSTLIEGYTVNAPFTYSSAVVFDGGITATDVVCETITVSGGSGTLVDITGDGANTATTIDGASKTALNLTTTSAICTTIGNDDAALPAMLINNVGGGPSMIVGSLAQFDGDMLLGSAAADAIIVPGTATFSETVNLAGGADASGQTISASVLEGSTIDTGSTGVLQANRIDWYTDTTPAVSDGEEQWNGFTKTLGDGSTAWPQRAPRYKYTVSDSTINANDDITGATLTLTINDDQDVLIKATAHQESDTAGVDVKLLIAATNTVDNVSILKLAQNDQAQSILPTVVAAGDRSPNSVTVVWRPTDDVAMPDNTNWTIYLRHGITGGATLDTTAILLEIQYL